MPTNITKLAIFSRLFIIILQCISNHLIEDHNAEDVFRAPQDLSVKTKKCDTIVEFLLGGFRRWDAEHFLHISEHGYTYENNLAFYPLYPLCIKMIRYVLINIMPFISVRSLSLLIGVLINVIFFAKAANALHELGRKVLRDQRKAEIAAILFCFNPASIFFTAPYSESLYCWLSFSLMLKCFEDINSVLIVVPLSLSILCRSNGLINIGFVVYYGFKKMFNQSTILSFVTVFLKVFSILIIIAFHFGLMQVYNYYLFCFQKSFHFPDFIRDFAIENDFVLAGNRSQNASSSPWCLNNIPVAYSYIQEHYWNVGYFNYYELKQIPNFLLATPVVLIILVNAFAYFIKNQDYCWRLGIFNLRHTILRKTSVADQNQFVFVAHAVAVCFFCLLFIHVQVTTRLLASSNPMLYFFCANYFIIKNPAHKKNDDAMNEIAVNIFDLKRLNWTQRIIVYYFLGYYSLGTILFSNFLPWT